MPGGGERPRDPFPVLARQEPRPTGCGSQNRAPVTHQRDLTICIRDLARRRVVADPLHRQPGGRTTTLAHDLPPAEVQPVRFVMLFRRT